MRTRLALFCDRLIEAGWLAAVAVTPLFFNLWTARTFEPDKAALLRVIVLVMVGAWVVREIGDGRLEIRDWRSETQKRFNLQSLISNPSLWALLLGALLILSAVFGLNPRLSLLGSYNRDQGVVTHLAYLGLFLLVLARLRTREQLDRLLDTVVLTGVPLSLYAVLQRLGVDPIPWSGYGAAVTSRVIGSQGNATFLGGWLAMTMLVTLYQLLAARREGQGLRFGVLSAAFAVQALAFLFSDSRGPALGLGAGLLVWALAEAARRGQRRLAGLAVGVAATGVVALLVLNLAGGALGGVPLVGRLSRVLDPEVGSNQIRTLVWQGMNDMIVGRPERLALGVGPDALYLGYYPYFPVDARRLDNPTVGAHDRSHNEVLDRLAMTGILGTVAWLALVGSVLVAGANALGLTKAGRQQGGLVLALAGGALVGGLLPWLIYGSLRLSGVGVGLGLVAGLSVWLALRALTTRGEGVASFPPEQAVIPMLMGALVAHLVDIMFGISVTATQTLVWTLAGALAGRVVTGDWRLETENKGMQGESSTAGSEVRAKGRSAALSRVERKRDTRSMSTQSPVSSLQVSRLQSPLLGLVAGLILATLSFDFNVFGLNLGATLTTLLILGLLTLVVGAALSANMTAFLGASFGVWLAYLLPHALLAQTGPSAGPTVFTLFGLALMAWMVLFAGLALRSEQTAGGWPARGLAVAAPVALLVLAGVWYLAWRPISADTSVRLGQLYGQVGRWDQAVAAYEQAIRLAPEQDFFLPNVAQAYLAQAQQSTDPALKTAAFEQARSTLRRASALSPGNPEYLVNLGAAEQYWAERGPNPAEKLTLQAQAVEHYRQAAQLAPRDPHPLRRWGKLALEQGKTTEAVDLLERAMNLLVPTVIGSPVYQTRMLVADIAGDLARAYNAMGRRADAVALLQTAIRQAPAEGKPPLEDLLKQLGGGS